MNSIKRLSVTYDPINENKTFSRGDHISGRVTLEVEKETKIDSLLVKAKGKASVLWTEQYGKATVVYHDKETLFKLEHFFISEEEGKKGRHDEYSLLRDQSEMYSDVIPPGCHVYPFSFQIPHLDLPSSFKGRYGKVVYFLEAKLSRSMWKSTKDKAKFLFLSKSPNVPEVPDLKSQSGYAGNDLKLLNSGNISLNATIDGMTYHPGDELKITAEIQNHSSRTIKPKYCLYQKQSNFALKRRRVHTKDILKGAGQPIWASANQTVTLSLNIPSEVIPSIVSNCKVLKVEYRLKIYLDIKFSKNPIIKFPLIIATPDTPDGEATSEALMRTEAPPSYYTYNQNASLFNPSGSSMA